MAGNSLKRSLLISCILLFSVSGFAQNQTKLSERELFDELVKNEAEVEICKQKTREEQIAKFGKPLPKISGHCWNGECPVSITLPRYPREAQRLNITGSVKVEAVVDEKGHVILAKKMEGSSFLSEAAVTAAHKAKFLPRKTCNGRAIKYRQFINYNFRGRKVSVS